MGRIFGRLRSVQCRQNGSRIADAVICHGQAEALPPARRVYTVMFTGFELCRTLLFSRFSSSRASSASSTESTVCSAGSSCSSVIPQCSASGLSQNCATSCRNSGPARRSFRRRGWAPYSSLLVRFRSSMRGGSFPPRPPPPSPPPKKKKKSYFGTGLFCHNYSPYYILLFTFLLGYVYTVLLVSQNNSYVYVDNYPLFFV